MQLVCEDNSKAMPSTIVRVVELAREGGEAKPKNARLSERNTDMGSKLVEARAINSMMDEQLAGAKCHISTLETQLNESHLSLNKLASELSKTEWDPPGHVVVVEEAVKVERAPVKLLERDVAAEVETRKQVLA